MNLYYNRKQGIDIIRFWYEIAKMSVMPMVFVATSLWCMDYWEVNLISPMVFIGAVALFVAVYALLFWFASMNAFERNLFVAPFKKIGK